FAADAREYPGIGKNPGRVVVYFSRMGYARKLACEEADRIGARLVEIKARERTEGTLGFWWCGRFGINRWAMPIDDMDVDFAQCEHVTIVSPIWVFSLSSPVREFCRTARGSIKSVDYILVHHTSAGYKNAADEMDALLNVKRSRARSVRCSMGKYSRVVEI
ncbi:MAG: hypothetical protein Q4D04_12155, partial [Clostridia bacterium]|nr:hypothetical protein [Clostridia bacterium]